MYHLLFYDYGENMLERFLPDVATYMQLMDSRPHVRTMMADRDAAMAARSGLGGRNQAEV